MQEPLQRSSGRVRSGTLRWPTAHTRGGTKEESYALIMKSNAAERWKQSRKLQRASPAVSSLGDCMRWQRRAQARRAGLRKRTTPGKATAAMTLERYFDQKPGAANIPDAQEDVGSSVATDVATARRILHLKRAEHETDPDFRVVLHWLERLRNCPMRDRLRDLISKRRENPDVINGRKHFTYSGLTQDHYLHKDDNAAVKNERITINTETACVIYHISLLVLFRAKQWLSAAEQVPDLAPSASTPKTLGQLRSALEDPLVAPHLPFAADFEDGAGYGPIVSRLLFYAEMSAASVRSFGSYNKPNYRAPQTYGQLQEHVFAQRAQHTPDVQAQRRVETPDDLATMLQEFASDGFVLRALTNFALPPHRREKAASVEPRAAQAAGKLKTIDDSDTLPWVVRLASPTAARIASAFFEFLQQGSLSSRVAAMSNGQIVSLCLLHSRLSWQKGKPLQFHEALQHCLPKPCYAPAADVPAPSPAHFVQQVRAEGADAVPPDMQAPQVCLLCGKGFMDPPALWRHCDSEHHSWAEAVKRSLWEAAQLEDLPMLPAWKRRILANFAAALTYSRPGHGHYGRTKSCMRQLVGCATCAHVDWIDEFVPCYLFKDCPEELLAQDNSDNEASTGTDNSGDEKRRLERGPSFETTQATTYVMLQPSTLSLTFGSTSGRGF